MENQTEYKCCRRIRLEERLVTNDQQFEDDEKCEECSGYKRECPEYVNINHLLEFYRNYTIGEKNEN